MIYILCSLKIKGLICSSLKPENIFIEKDLNDKLKCLISRICKINDSNKLDENFAENYKALKSKYCNKKISIIYNRSLWNF